MLSAAVLAGAFVLGFLMGLAMAWSNFCTMGAVADFTLMGDKRRLAAWVTAMATAVVGFHLSGVDAAAATGFGEFRLDYLSPRVAWPRQVIGGLVFGVGMTLAAGCVSKNLLRLGFGSGKAAVTLAAAGATAYLLTETRAFEVLFHAWLGPLTLDLRRFGFDDQGLATLARVPEPLAAGVPFAVALVMVAAVAAVPRYRSSPAHYLGAVAIGAAVAGGWWLTGGPLGEAWIEAGLFADNPPRGLGAQSFTFVNPLGETGSLLLTGDRRFLTFGVAGAVGLAAGGAAWALLRREFRREWFHGWGDAARHVAGGLLMGTGGILALGCSIGQGITGVATLAVGSIIAVTAMIAGAFLSLRVQLALAG